MPRPGESLVDELQAQDGGRRVLRDRVAKAHELYAPRVDASAPPAATDADLVSITGAPSGADVNPVQARREASVAVQSALLWHSYRDTPADQLATTPGAKFVQGKPSNIVADGSFEGGWKFVDDDHEQVAQPLRQAEDDAEAKEATASRKVEDTLARAGLSPAVVGNDVERAAEMIERLDPGQREEVMGALNEFVSKTHRGPTVPQAPASVRQERRREVARLLGGSRAGESEPSAPSQPQRGDEAPLPAGLDGGSTPPASSDPWAMGGSQLGTGDVRASLKQVAEALQGLPQYDELGLPAFDESEPAVAPADAGQPAVTGMLEPSWLPPLQQVPDDELWSPLSLGATKEEQLSKRSQLVERMRSELSALEHEAAAEEEAAVDTEARRAVAAIGRVWEALSEEERARHIQAARAGHRDRSHTAAAKRVAHIKAQVEEEASLLAALQQGLLEVEDLADHHRSKALAQVERFVNPAGAAAAAAGRLFGGSDAAQAGSIETYLADQPDIPGMYPGGRDAWRRDFAVTFGAEPSKQDDGMAMLAELIDGFSSQLAAQRGDARGSILEPFRQLAAATQQAVELGGMTGTTPPSAEAAAAERLVARWQAEVEGQRGRREEHIEAMSGGGDSILSQFQDAEGQPSADDVQRAGLEMARLQRLEMLSSPHRDVREQASSTSAAEQLKQINDDPMAMVEQLQAMAADMRSRGELDEEVGAGFDAFVQQLGDANAQLEGEDMGQMMEQMREGQTAVEEAVAGYNEARDAGLSSQEIAELMKQYDGVMDK